MNPLAKLRHLGARTDGSGKGYSDENANYNFPAEDASITNPTVQWLTAAKRLAARIAIYFNTSTNVGYASLQGIGTSSGDTGIGEIMGLNRNTTKYAYVQAKSNGQAIANLRNGSDKTRSLQNLTVQGESSTTNNETTILSLEAYCSGTSAAGFGSRAQFYAQNGSGDLVQQAAIYGEFVGGAVNSDFVIESQRSVRFAQGTTPAVTGVRTGTLGELQTVMQNLLAALDTMGLIDDQTT